MNVSRTNSASPWRSVALAALIALAPATASAQSPRSPRAAVLTEGPGLDDATVLLQVHREFSERGALLEEGSAVVAARAFLPTPRAQELDEAGAMALRENLDVERLVVLQTRTVGAQVALSVLTVDRGGAAQRTFAMTTGSELATEVFRALHALPVLPVVIPAVIAAGPESPSDGATVAAPESSSDSGSEVPVVPPTASGLTSRTRLTVSGLFQQGGSYGAGVRLLVPVLSLGGDVRLAVGGDVGFLYGSSSGYGLTASVLGFPIAGVAALRIGLGVFELAPRLGLGVAITSVSTSGAPAGFQDSGSSGVGVFGQAGVEVLVKAGAAERFYASFDLMIAGGTSFLLAVGTPFAF